MMTKKLDRWLLTAFVLATLVGTALHFLFDFLPSGATAILSPVRESIWEHVKLVYWPGLVAAIWCGRREGHGRMGAWCGALVLACIFLLITGWAYSVALEGDQLAVHIALFVISMAVFFLLPRVLTPLGRWSMLGILAVVVLGCAIAWFTFQPPEGSLFADFSLASSWYQLPC